MIRSCRQFMKKQGYITMQAESSSPCPSEPPKQPGTDITQVYTAPPGTIAPPVPVQSGGTAFKGQPQIYVGSVNAVTQATLEQYQIMGVLNVAYDADDLPPANVYHQFNPAYQLAKIGLIDGSGNDLSTLVAAVLMADQLLNFPPATPDPALVNIYNPWWRGSLLIHCYDGGSRSVTIAALYLYYKFGLYYGQTDLSTFDKAYQHVINTRAPFAPNELTTGMCQAARDMVATYDTLFPGPVSSR